MKFGVGQLVRVKDFGELAHKYVVENCGVIIGDYFFEREMKIYCGETFRVKSCFDGVYELFTEDDSMWVFAGEVLELPTEKTIYEKYEELQNEVDALKTDKVEVEEKPKRQYTRKAKEIE